MILILGGSSYFGRTLFGRLGPARAVATYRKHWLRGGVHFDALTMDIADAVPDISRFSHAVVLLANAKPDACVQDRRGSEQLNVVKTCSVLDQLFELGIVPIFASTESVFDGIKGAYVETDEPHPILVYGRQKLAVERHLQERGDGFLIVRLARVFSLPPEDGTLLTSWLEQIDRNAVISCASDQIFSPIEVTDAADAIVALAETRCHGIFHVANPDSISRIDLLRKLIAQYDRYGEYRGQVIERKLNDFPAAEPRPLDTSLCPDKLLNATGIDIKNIERCCELSVENWFERSDRRLAV